MCVYIYIYIYMSVFTFFCIMAYHKILNVGFPGASDGKESACDAEDVGNEGSILGLGRSPGEGDDNPLQYSFLENPMDRGAWRATVHGVTKHWTRLSDFTFFS